MSKTNNKNTNTNTINNKIINEPSIEQLDVIESCADNNVIVDSVAGSGKTTVILHVALKYPNKKILHLTYNKKLRLETIEKVKKLGIINLETHTYHSFCVKYYDSRCINDSELCYRMSTAIIRCQINYDMIILDEAQDISELYYKIIKKIYYENGKASNICVLGDRKQSINEFNNADKRFIVFADKIFDFNKYPWKRCNLSTSYRVNDKMCNFINNCMFDYSFMNFNKAAKFKPHYVICNTFGLKPFTMLCEMLERKYKPDDVFVLAPSTRSANSPCRKLENNIKNMYSDTLIYVPNSDEENLDSDVIKDKMVFSTFHQAKGLERKVVFVFGFDDLYFSMYKGKSNKEECPNELYVACTRATEHLIVFHHYMHDYLTFLNQKALKKYTNMIIDTPLKIKQMEDKPRHYAVTDLTRHLPFDVINECLSKIKYYTVKPADVAIEIKAKIEENNKDIKYYELVSDITGTAIPLLYEMVHKQKIPDALEDLFTAEEIKFENVIKSDGINIPLFLRLVNKYMSSMSGYIYKYSQITKYEWLTIDQINRCFKRLDSLNISEKARFEKDINTDAISGRIDCVDNVNLYEFKCVQSLDDNHIIQLAIYAYMFSASNIEFVENYYLYNILTDELITINLLNSKLEELIKYLLKHKRTIKNDTITDDEFVKKTNKAHFNVIKAGSDFLDDD